MSVSFPTGNSNADKSARLTAASITLQNLNGPGKGCPVVSTTFPLQQKAINAGTDVSPAPSPPAQTQPTSTPVQTKPTPTPVQTKPAPTPVTNNAINENNNGSLSVATIESLAPALGFQSGLNPTGSGDCDGAVNGANGQPIKIPCSCPPSQDVYLNVRCLSTCVSICCVDLFALPISVARQERSGGDRREQPFGES